MKSGLEGKVVIVTGGASGIGASIVEQLIDEDAIAIILDRNAPAEAWLTGLQERSPLTDWISADLCDDAQCVAAVKEVSRRLPKIDALVNNAGINDCVGLEAGPAEFRNSLDRNLVHYYTMAHLCLPELKKHRGSIVNIGSKVSITGQGKTSAYAAAKGAHLSLTREWAAELARDGVRVNAVIPGETMTPMYETWLQSFESPEEKLEGIVKNIPLDSRMTKPSEIAATVLFLLSDRASHTTGQWLVVDGGYSHLDRALT